MTELKELGFEYLPTLNEFRKELIKRDEDTFDALNMINKYGDFIDQKPKLGDFIPCIDGVPIDEPEISDFEYEHFYEQNGQTETRIDYEFFGACKKHYQQALEQVKFECKKELDTYWVSGEKFQFMVETVCKCPTYEHAINEGVKFKIK